MREQLQTNSILNDVNDTLCYAPPCCLSSGFVPGCFPGPPPRGWALFLGWAVSNRANLRGGKELVPARTTVSVGRYRYRGQHYNKPLPWVTEEGENQSIIPDLVCITNGTSCNGRVASKAL